MSFKNHIEKLKTKFSLRNNLLQRLITNKWGAHLHTLRCTALALCFSLAEYAAPVWERSLHAHKLDTILNKTCRMITGCLKPTRASQLYILSGIAPPKIRRATANQIEKRKQETDSTHPLFEQIAHNPRLKSRKHFLNTVQLLLGSAKLHRIYT